jgi:hypothetical protein
VVGAAMCDELEGVGIECARASQAQEPQRSEICSNDTGIE